MHTQRTDKYSRILNLPQQFIDKEYTQKKIPSKSNRSIVYTVPHIQPNIYTWISVYVFICVRLK